MLILLGKTSTGKSIIAEKLVSDYGYEKIVTYTSRPMRDGEVNGKDYHFIDEKTFFDKIDNKDFMEYKVYHTVDGDWYYGTAKEDIVNSSQRSVIILTPAGYKDFLDKCYAIPHISILIKTNKLITKLRLKKRGDNSKEAKRRMKHDDKDFEFCEEFVDHVVKNNGINENSINDVVNKIYKLHMLGKKV